jgi:hypothetical protein
MAQFNRTLGEIPMEFGGGNRYRVVWAPSRKILRFTSGVSETVSAYSPNGGIQPIGHRMDPQHKDGECWILEMWRNPYRDCTEQEWNTVPCVEVAGQPMPMTRLAAMGPFPRRGYYWHAENTYLYGEPSHTQVESQILLVEDGLFRHTKWDNLTAIRRKIEAGEKKLAARNKDMIRDRHLIGGGEAYSARGGHRGTKTINTNRDTRHLKSAGFKTAPGTVSVTPRRKKLIYDMTAHIQP